MSEPILVALDSGTSVVKGLAFDAAGKVVAQASRPNVIASGPGAMAEQDMARTWEDASAVLGELAERLDGRELAALAITGQGDGTWLVAYFRLYAPLQPYLKASWLLPDIVQVP
jgi:erythritol kinase (D-erythritol 1-phosphate-forming)